MFRAGKSEFFALFYTKIGKKLSLEKWKSPGILFSHYVTNPEKARKTSIGLEKSDVPPPQKLNFWPTWLPCDLENLGKVTKTLLSLHQHQCYSTNFLSTGSGDILHTRKLQVNMHHIKVMIKNNYSGLEASPLAKWRFLYRFPFPIILVIL